MIKVHVLENPLRLGGETVEALLARLPEWRRRDAERFVQEKDRILSVRAYLLLNEALRETYGFANEEPFDYGDCGKPRLRIPRGMEFNLSHCDRAVMCAVGDEPVGCDVETVPPAMTAAEWTFAEYCCNDDELRRISQAERPQTELIRLWTMKEALLKLTGCGMTDNLKDLLRSPMAQGKHFGTTVAADGTYVYSVCTMSPHTP